MGRQCRGFKDKRRRYRAYARLRIAGAFHQASKLKIARMLRWSFIRYKKDRRYTGRTNSKEYSESLSRVNRPEDTLPATDRMQEELGPGQRLPLLWRRKCRNSLSGKRIDELTY